MLYGSNNFTPNDEKLLQLHEEVMDKIESISWSHCSLAAVASKPKLFKQISELIIAKQAWWGAEIGIETGSPDLAKKIMPAKALPFKPEEWPEVVKQGMGLMHDNLLVPAGTIIVGLPEEREEDLLKTMEMIDDLKDCRSLIVPLFFVPLGKLKSEDWFKDTEITELHRQLLIQCCRARFSLDGQPHGHDIQRKMVQPSVERVDTRFLHTSQSEKLGKKSLVLCQKTETKNNVAT